MQQGDQHIGFGIMGGLNQPLAHAQFVSNVVDYGMNIQAATAASLGSRAQVAHLYRAGPIQPSPAHCRFLTRSGQFS
jgi:gamma-glutamyltranspeptidase